MSRLVKIDRKSLCAGAAVLFIALISGCGTEKLRNLSATRSQWFELYNSGKLPGMEQKPQFKDVSFFSGQDFYSHPTNFPAFQPFATRCQKSCWARVECEDRRLWYLFCIDSSSAELIGSFTWTDGTLFPLKE